MGRKVIKLLPDRMIFVGKIESWLKDMAKQGLIVKKVKRFYAVFEKGKAQDVEFKVIAYEKDNSDELLNYINDSGWDLVAKNIRTNARKRRENQIYFMVFKCSNAKGEKQLQDTIFIPYLNKQLEIEIEAGKALIVVLFTCILMMIIYIGFKMFTISLIFLVEKLLLVLIVSIAAVILFIKDFKRLKTLGNESKIKDNLNYIPKWKFDENRIILKAILQLILVAFVTMPIVINMNYTNLSSGANLGDIDSRVTLVRIQDFEHPDQYDFGTDIDGNCLLGYRMDSFLAPKNYYMWELGSATIDSEEISFWLSTTYAELISSRYAYKIYDRAIISDTKKYEGKYVNSTLSFVDVNSELFDAVTCAEDEERVYVWVCYDRTYVYIKYKGDKSSQELVVALEKILN